MLKQLYTLEAICDNCGYDQEYTSDALKLPQGWGKAHLQQYKHTHMQDETHDLCPECAIKFKNGELSKKYY